MALSEWHLTPAQLNEDWTEEMIALLLQARVDRLRVKKTKHKDYTPSASDDGKYRPEHHTDAANIAGKMAAFGSTAFKVTKR